MASAIFRNTTKDTRASAASPARPFQTTPAIRDPAVGAEKNWNAESTPSRSARNDPPLSGVLHRFGCGTDGSRRWELYRTGAPAHRRSSGGRGGGNRVCICRGAAAHRRAFVFAWAAVALADILRFTTVCDFM